MKLPKYSVGDLVFRKSSSRINNHIPIGASKFFGMGVILKKLHAVNGLSYYSVYWHRLNRAQNTPGVALMTIDEERALKR